MRRFFASSIVLVSLLSVRPALAQKGAACGVNMVPVADICVDKFEASVWSLPPSDNKGDPQGQQFGATFDNYPCMDNGNDCSGSNPIYAASVPGVRPSAFVTWFQAQQACLNVGKRLLRNDEWQGIAAGTPDPGAAPSGTDCNTNSLDLSFTGSRSGCVSNFGVFDLVGNVWEWVADWMQDIDSDLGPISTAAYGDDEIFGVNDAFPEIDRFPAAIVRGGHFFNGTNAGVFALVASVGPSSSFHHTGFRCARNR